MCHRSESGCDQIGLAVAASGRLIDLDEANRTVEAVAQIGRAEATGDKVIVIRRPSARPCAGPGGQRLRIGQGYPASCGRDGDDVRLAAAGSCKLIGLEYAGKSIADVQHGDVGYAAARGRR